MMKTKAIQKTAIDAGVTLAGSVVGYKALGMVPGKIGPLAVLGAGAVGHVMSSSPVIKSLALGAAVMGGIATLNQLSRPDASGVQKGYQRMIASVTPQLSLPVSGLAELDYEDYDFEPIQGIQGNEEVAQALLAGDFDDTYEEISGLYGDEQDVAEALLGY